MQLRMNNDEWEVKILENLHAKLNLTWEILLDDKE